MASLATNVSTFLFLFPLGIRRLFCSCSLYLNNPSLYRSHPWYFTEPRWKNFDLYALLVALPIASFSDLFFFFTFSGHPTLRFAFLQQSTVVSLFWVLVILIIIREAYYPLAIPENYIFLFAGITFLIEYMMMGRGFEGLGGSMYGWLGGLTLVCVGCCLYMSIRPSAFFAEFMLSTGLVFKGTWALQIGLSLFTDAFSVKGCDEIPMYSSRGENDVECALEEDKLRGVALTNLLFIGHATVVLIASSVLFSFLSRHQNMRWGESRGPLLAELDSESTPMRGLSEFEFE